MVLEKREGQHREQRVVVQAEPAAPFEVIEAEFFLQLLMGLLAHPPGLDRRSKRTQRGAAGRDDLISRLPARTNAWPLS